MQVLLKLLAFYPENLMCRPPYNQALCSHARCLSARHSAKFLLEPHACHSDKNGMRQ